ncbi:MAG: TlpA family protein disulfide reductase [Acidobacteriota bacterium]|nr:TlpA family protein disulfide reductase [Acidobacteriota bacterium]
MKISKRTWLVFGVAAIILGCLLGILWRRQPRALAVGSRAPDFTLQKVSEGAFSFKDAGHRVTLINFWATWCPPCVMETPSLERFAKEMQPLGVRVIGVSVDQNPQALQQFVTDHNLTYAILRDPNQSLAGRFGTYKFPETYIFDRNGRLASKIIGATDWDSPQMIEFVKALVHWPPASGAVPKPAAAGNW